MVKFKRKAIQIILSILTATFVIMGLLSLNVAYADSERVRISSESAGFVQSEDEVLNANTSLSMSFDLIYNVKGGTYLGFGICATDSVSNSFLDESNVDAGYSVLFGENTTITGGGENYSILNNCNKNDLLRESYRYRATFDNKTHTFILERKVLGPNPYFVIQKVNNIKPLDDGTYAMALMYSENFEIVVENITFSVDESEVADLGAYKTDYVNENGETVSNITETKAENSDKGVAYTEINSTGISAYTNTNPMTKSANGQVVIAFTTSLFKFDEKSEIGFAIGTSVENGIIKGENSIYFGFNENNGINKYINGDLVNSEFIESDLNMYSIFSSNRAVKAVFNVKTGVFNLLVRFYEGSEFVEVGRVSGLTLPQDNFYMGLQFNGKADLKLVGLSIFNSRELEEYSTRACELSCDRRNMGVTENADGTTTFSLTQKDGSHSGNSNEVIYTKTPVNVKQGESVIVYIKDIKDFAMKNWEYMAKASFIFANNAKDATQYMYSNNTSFSMFYENSRTVYFLKNRERDIEDADLPKEEKRKSSVSESLGSSITFYDIFKNGNSVMAVFNPEYQSYALYVKSANDSDFSLIQSFVIPKNKAEEIDLKVNNNIYVGFELYYGMTMTVSDYAVFTAKTEEVGVATSENTISKGQATSKKGGFVLEAKGQSYINFTADNINNCDGIAIEYGIESLTNADGSYLLGFMITDGEKLPDFPFVKNRKDNTNFVEEPGAYIEGTKSVMYAFVPPVGLTNDLNGKMRDYLFHSGYKIRAVFSFTDKTTTIQYKDQTAHSWNDIAVYDDLPEYVNTDKITVAIRLQNSVKISLNSLKAYTLKNEISSFNYTSDNTEDVGPAVMRNIKAESEDLNKGNVYIGEEGITEVNALDGTTLELIAVPEKDHIFTGWYVDGKLVSKESYYSVDVETSAIYKAKFAPSARVVIKNGLDKYSTEVDNQYEENKYLGINPQKVYGYEFVGWEISSYQANDTGVILLSKYILSLKSSEENNLIKDKSSGLKVWKTLKNDLVSGDNCGVIKDETGATYISFGKFTIIDKQGNENGSLIIRIPPLENIYENDELKIENYIQIEAKYQEKELIESGSYDTYYGDEYKDNLNKTQMWLIIISSLTVAVIIVLVVIKIFLVKRNKGRK